MLDDSALVKFRYNKYGISFISQTYEYLANNLKILNVIHMKSTEKIIKSIFGSYKKEDIIKHLEMIVDKYDNNQNYVKYEERDFSKIKDNVTQALVKYLLNHPSYNEVRDYFDKFFIDLLAFCKL